jgi:hypothetical protein
MKSSQGWKVFVINSHVVGNNAALDWLEVIRSRHMTCKAGVSLRSGQTAIPKITDNYQRHNRTDGVFYFKSAGVQRASGTGSIQAGCRLEANKPRTGQEKF